MLGIGLYWCLLAPGLPAVDTLVTPDASPEARALQAWLAEVAASGRTLAGQQEGFPPEAEHTYLRRTTGHEPALRGFDLMGYSPAALGGRGIQPWQTDIERAIAWWRGRGVVAFCWHWFVPDGRGGRAFYAKDNGFDIVRSLSDGTAEHQQLLGDLDAIALQLARLRDAHVPVLWRPLHENSGAWFWWGAKGAEPCRRLWRLMFERFTRVHRLTNLIWVFNPGDAADLPAWYPGDAYVDVIGIDKYAPPGSGDVFAAQYRLASAFNRAGKALALTENGPVPDVAQMRAAGVPWVWFMTWYGAFATGSEHTSVARLLATYRDPQVVTRDQVPDDLGTRSAPTPGEPAALAFVRAPQRWARAAALAAVTVAVRDAAGRTVRGAPVAVTLEVVGGGGRPDGTLTVLSDNGIATFPDLRWAEAGSDLRLVARAPGLAPAASAPFAIGPGAGLAWERWEGLDDQPTVASLRQHARFAGPPDAHGVLGDVAAMPMNIGDRYGTRLRAILLPPQDGDYVFWISADDHADLLLAQDGDPAHARVIASAPDHTDRNEWTRYPAQRSPPLHLTAGMRCYLEVLHKEATGDDHVEIGWTRPDGIVEQPLPAWWCEPYYSNASGLQPGDVRR